MSTPNENDKKDALEVAKQKLSEISGRPFDVDKILAANRAKEERQRKVAKTAQAKIEQTIKAARERRHIVRENELESENENIQEAKLRAAAKQKAQARGEDRSGKA